MRSLKDYPSMSYPENANLLTHADNDLILSELNFNNEELRSEFLNLFSQMTVRYRIITASFRHINSSTDSLLTSDWAPTMSSDSSTASNKVELPFIRKPAIMQFRATFHNDRIVQTLGERWYKSFVCPIVSRALHASPFSPAIPLCPPSSPSPSPATSSCFVAATYNLSPPVFYTSNNDEDESLEQGWGAELGGYPRVCNGNE
ncbi:hypothetical protein JHK86_052548 [Glycine max]|nr:hypothetical protein JHK86_052548 [Glycine max]